MSSCLEGKHRVVVRLMLVLELHQGKRRGTHDDRRQDTLKVAMTGGDPQ